MPVILIVDILTHFDMSTLRNVIQIPLHKEIRLILAVIMIRLGNCVQFAERQ